MVGGGGWLVVGGGWWVVVVMVEVGAGELELKYWDEMTQ